MKAAPRGGCPWSADAAWALLPAEVLGGISRPQRHREPPGAGAQPHLVPHRMSTGSARASPAATAPRHQSKQASKREKS